MKIWPLLFLIVFLTSELLQAAGGAKRGVSMENFMNEPLSQGLLNTSTKTIFQRVVQARLFHSGVWTLAGNSQSVARVGRTLASLQPSFLIGMIRLSDTGKLSRGEVEGFESIRKMVLTANKNCRFDLLINAGVEESGEAFAERLKEFSMHLHPDAWTLYVAPETKSITPAIFEQGISAAHAAGQMVGYDGPLSLIPEGVDFIVIRAWEMKVNKHQIDLLRAKQRVPLIVELPTTFGSKDFPEVVSYVEEMETKERVSIITQLAENQNSWGYHFAYPVFYPLYPARHAFDSTKDNILLVSIRALLAKFN